MPPIEPRDCNENGNGDEEETGAPDISEMARRWSQNAPEEPSEDFRGSENGDIVTYHGRGNIYVPQALREKIGMHEWASPAQFPAQYDENTNELTIQFGPVTDDSETVATDGGGLSEAALAELIADLRGDGQ